MAYKVQTTNPAEFTAVVSLDLPAQVSGTTHGGATFTFDDKRYVVQAQDAIREVSRHVDHHVDGYPADEVHRHVAAQMQFNAVYDYLCAIVPTKYVGEVTNPVDDMLNEIARGER
jgi:hypothetical protein